MQREPLGFYILRLFLLVAILVMLGMLYWSNLLIEEQLQQLRRQQAKPPRVDRQASSTGPSERSRPHMSADYPNLLTEDPFYETTLATLLPPHFEPSGVLRTAVVGKPDNLHPFSNWSHVSSWISQCSGTVSSLHFGRYETMTPDLAIKMEERVVDGRSEFWIHLREGVFWEPLEQTMFSDAIELAPHFMQAHAVTAEDFKFYWDALMNPWVQQPGAVALRTYLEDIESIRVIDPLTFVVRWKTRMVTEPDGTQVEKIKYIAKSMTGALRPLPSFVYKYFADGTKIVDDDASADTYRTNSVWAQNFNQHWAKNIIVSCGPWIFEGMTDRQITFKRNPDYFEPLAVLVEGMEVDFKAGPENIWQDFKAGKIDSYSLRPDQLSELKDFLESEQYREQAARGLSVNRLDYLTRSYSFIGWNMSRQPFNSKAVRQALTMGINRQRIIDQVMKGMATQIDGPFFLTSKAYDHSLEPWPYDPQEAQLLLDQQGWVDHDGDGILDKDGKPFKFKLTYYVKNPTSQAIGQYVALELKKLGIAAELHGVDLADLSAVFDDKNFDALTLAWALGTPPEEPRQLWYSTGAKEKGSSNAVGFSNPEVDAIIDALAYEYDPEKRIALYHRFDAIIRDESPYTFLFTPKNIFLYRDTLQNVFIPADRQDLVPGADMSEPQPTIFWLRPPQESNP